MPDVPGETSNQVGVDRMNFLITGAERSGTTFLGRSIGKCPGVEYFREAFNPCYRRYGNERVWNSADLHALERILDHPCSGVKVLYNHGFPAIWDRLASERKLRVVHMVRDDMIEQWASTNVMMRTGRAIFFQGEPEIEIEPFALDPVQAEERFRDVFFWRDRIRSMFGGHAYLEIRFEDLFAAGTIESAFAFLGLEYRDEYRVNTVPTPRKPARELVTNYSEIEVALERVRIARRLEGRCC